MQLGIEHKIKSFSATLLIFAIMITVLFLIHLSTPIPPYPEGGGGEGLGLEVNLGSVPEASAAENVSLNIPEISEEKNIEKEKIMTQDYEESDAIKQSDDKKPIKKKVVKENKIIEKNQHKNIPEIESKALFKKTTGSKEGTSAGSPDGTEGKSLYSGPAGQGEGGGTGGGKGTGVGTGVGNGISFNLEGRNPVSLKIPEYNYQTEGKVVVEITVDKDGKVINAVPGVKGSTTLDEYLLQVAKNAALESRFSPNPKAAVQKGTITYRFILQ